MARIHVFQAGPFKSFAQSTFALPIHLRAKRFGGHHFACIHERSGGEYRARTGDLLVANQALSQLS